MIHTLQIDPKIRIRSSEDLLLCPLIIRVGTISERSARVFSTRMSLAYQAGQPIIPIVIDSYGGDVYALLTMIDIIQTSKVPIATIVEGKAFSCGSILFTCGTEGYRFIGPNATLMIHDVSSIEERKKAEEVKADARETDRLNRKLYALMEKNIGQPKSYLWDLAQARSRADWYIMPKQAVKHNLANQIGIPSLVTRVSVETELTW